VEGSVSRSNLLDPMTDFGNGGVLGFHWYQTDQHIVRFQPFQIPFSPFPPSSCLLSFFSLPFPPQSDPRNAAKGLGSAVAPLLEFGAKPQPTAFGPS